ncbi:MAG: SMC-Scp complex subunit ScpB [Candidatus Buchananbacteria bacterium]|nr:SMC-Scp complex subunit ScpB [Candidatus Buchananbacteria bacterium]
MADLKAKIESLLFITNQPLSVKRLIGLTKAEKTEINKALDELMAEYNNKKGGLNLQKIGDQVQMVTSADNSKLVKDFIKEETTGDLTKASLETLTIIAYRGPVSRAEIEQIRGVNCSVILRNLAMRGLIDSNEDKTKMQIVYNITFDFLKFLGLNQQADLPDYEKLNSSQALQKLLDQDNQPTASTKS